MARKPKYYSLELCKRVESRIPSKILQTMNRLGWNVFGIYAVVTEEHKKLAKEEEAETLSKEAK